MFIKFFDTSAVDRFADSIVTEVKQSLPLKPAPGGKSVAERSEKLNQRISQRTQSFVGALPPLNIYKKARLADRVRNGLTEHGYPESFVKSFAYDLIARVQSGAKGKSRRS